MPMLMFPPAEPHSLMMYSAGPAGLTPLKGISMPSPSPQVILNTARRILTRPAIVTRTK